MMAVQDKAQVDPLNARARSPSFARDCRESGSQSASPGAVDLTVPDGWGGRLAYGISQVGSPPVLALVAMLLTASTLSNPRAWMWAGTHVLCANLTPLLYLIWLLHRGLVTDLDVQIREQRIRPMVFTTVCVGLAGFVLMLGAAPWQMIVVAAALWVQTVVIFGITLRWKISVHCTTAAGVATLAWILAGTPLPLLVGVPLVAWSRVRLRRHTLAQTAAGTMLGLVIFLGAFWLMYRG